MLNIINKTNDKTLNKYFKDIEYYYLRTLKILKLDDKYDLSLIIVGPITIKRLNTQYRHITKETDVLSFSLFDNLSDIKYIDELGDIFINIKRVYAQAKDYKHSIKREFIFLFVHGLLHLLGYDHLNKKDEIEMFKLQDKILKDLK